jgi:spore germination protein KA
MNNNSDEKNRKADTSQKSIDEINNNIERIKQTFGNSGDLVVNLIKDGSGRLCCASVFILGLSDGDILNSISAEINKLLCEDRSFSSETLFEHISCMRNLKTLTNYEEACQELLLGNTLFLTETADIFRIVSTNSNEGRAITEPTSQTIIKGPKDAFTENINKNIFLIRKRIRNTALRIESLTIGTVTHTNIKLVYINGIAKAEILNDIRSRLQRMQIDCVLDSNYIEELGKSSKYSIFPTVLSSEKPDSVSAAILEGRVAVLVDGSPYIMTAPALMVEFLQASEDYYHEFIISSFMRLIRYTAVILTLLVPALFVTMTTFHQEIIPAPLLISIAAQREGVPFPAFFEVLLLEFTFEVLREAGIRMPRAIGSAISIVGALVLGQAAVEAGLISAAVVIVISVTAISSFVITNYAMSNAIRLLRFVFLFLAGALGIYGISMGLILLCLHLCSLKSAGVPYILSSFKQTMNKDGLIRFPLWKMKNRPASISADKTPRVNEASLMDSSVKDRPENIN